MRHKVILLIPAVLITVSACQPLPKLPSPVVEEISPAPRSFNMLSDRQKVTLAVGEKLLEVEVVNTPQSITQGLSDRSEIGSDGMLFILPEPGMPGFWMVRMQFNLDLVWINDQKVVEVTANVPKPIPGTPESQLPIYPPSTVVDMVLEIPAGKAEEWAITPGVSLELR